jgi:hypothetical protein
MENHRELSNVQGGRLPLHPKTVTLNKNFIEKGTILSSDNNTVLDTISSNDSRQYYYNSPQMNMQFNNKLKELNLPSENFGSDIKPSKPYLRSIESPQHTAYFVGSSTKNNDNDNFGNFNRDQVTPNSLDYSASTDFNPRNSQFHAFQNKNMNLSKNLGNIESQHSILQKAYPYHYDEHQFATLGQSPEQQESRFLSHDEELESTVFGQSSIIGATFNEGTTRMSDEQAYFGNLKANTNTMGGLGGTGLRANYNSNFQSISSSAESTPHKAFKTNLMAKKHQLGFEVITGNVNRSQDSIMKSYDSS